MGGIVLHSIRHSLPTLSLKLSPPPPPSPSILSLSLPHYPYPSPPLPSRDEDGLVVPILQHVGVGIVCDGVDVWRHLSPPLPLEQVNDLFCVNRKVAVRVDGNTEQA